MYNQEFIIQKGVWNVSGDVNEFKGIVPPNWNFCHYLFTLMSFQTCKTFVSNVQKEIFPYKNHLYWPTDQNENEL